MGFSHRFPVIIGVKMKRFSRTTALVLACALFAASFVFAADFTDVAESYWGYKAIFAAAEAGIINGIKQDDETFRFEPERDVSQQEANVMISRTMKALGLTQEEAPFETGERRKAPREWVAKTTAETLGLNSTPLWVLRYNDYSNISTDCVAAIDAMYRYGLMTGDNNHNINAQDGIKRVEFATICARMLEKFPASLGGIEATASKARDVVDIAGVPLQTFAAKRSLTVSDGSGRTVYVKFAPEAKIILNGSETTFDEMLKQVGAGFVFGAVAGSENTVVVTTEMKVQKGSITRVAEHSDYTLVVIDGVSYFADERTKKASLSEGRSVSFINEGAWLREIN
jgi:hypothetical protein